MVPFPFRSISAVLLITAALVGSAHKLNAQNFFAALAESADSVRGEASILDAFNLWRRTTPLDSAWGWKAFGRWAWFTGQRSGPEGEAPDIRAYWSGSQQVAEWKREDAGARIASGTWTPIGPTDVPPSDSPFKIRGLGRINCVTFHPTDPKTLWVGVAQGGVWKSVNGGESWMPLTDDLPMLRISDIAVDPTNPDVLYISIGDFGYVGVALFTDGRKRHTHYGLGVFKTTDGGATWAPTGLSFTQDEFDGTLIRRVFVHPDNPANLVAAGTSGIWTSFDAGATWTNVSDRFIWDIEQNPYNPNTLYASAGFQEWLNLGTPGILISNDFGERWRDVSDKVPDIGEARRTELTVSAADTNYIYAVSSADHQGLHAVYRSTDAGTTWERRTQPDISPNILGLSTGRAEEGDAVGGQGWYDLIALADPDDRDRLYSGGLNVWASPDGGQTWEGASYGSMYKGESVHFDQHFLAFNRLDKRYYLCNDGGIYSTDKIYSAPWSEVLGSQIFNWETDWKELSDGLAVTSFYRVGVTEAGSQYVVAGSQDNSTYLRSDDGWLNILGGDGMECLFDPTDPSFLYGSAQYGNIFMYQHANMVSRLISPPITETGLDAGEWTTPMELDPENPDRLYAAMGNLWLWDRPTETWAQVSQFTPDAPFSNPLPASAFGVAPSDRNRMYFARRPWHPLGVGCEILTSSNAGRNWIDITTGVPSTLYITDLSIDPNDPETLWITASGFEEGLKVFRTTDAGQTWENMSHNLPNLPANTIVHDPGSAGHTVYVGMDVGVYYISGGSNEWRLYNEGLPNVIVSELEVNPAAGRLVAATFGRGLWEVPLATSSSVENRTQDDPEEVSASMILNQSDETITLRIDRWPSSGTLKLNILDITGRRVLSDAFQLRGQEERSYRADLPYGVYFAILDDGSKRHVIRFVSDRR